MLAYVLAIVVAIGSFSFYMTAFFVPEMHRRQDFLWSGLGLFYAVVLWFCAGRITGAVLLGQTVSVALLGGLGWHALALRRDLTPATVRTPIAWSDVEQWGQTLQRFLSEQLQLGSASATLKALWANSMHQLANLRKKTAGPRGMDSDVPPLQRSPAYEFETDTGTGETVPSEFATLSTQERSVAEERDRAAMETEPLPDQIAQSSESAAVEPPPMVEAELIEEPTDVVTTSAPVPQAITPAQSAAQKTNPVAGVTRWLGNVVKGTQRPQPQRGVVEIPPRPPSIPRSPSSTTEPVSAPTGPQSTVKPKSQRGVIDIPPRPPSIPRSPQPDTEPSPQPAAKQQRGRQTTSPRGVINIPPRPPSIPRSPQPATESAGSTDDDTNWLDVDASDDVANSVNQSDANGSESNWTDQGIRPSSPPSPAVSPASSERPAPSTNEADTNWAEDEPETNWPDDDDTNWPD
jgi:hypothetical protein